MEVILKTEDREFKAQVNDLEELYQAVKDGMISMSYHPKTANQFIEELKNPEE